MSEAALLPSTAASPAPSTALRLLPQSPGHAGPPAATAPPRVELAPYDLRAALMLEQELGISHALAQVLVRRGFDQPGFAREFLSPTERYEPDAFDGIDRAVATIQRHVRAGGRIVVHGDYDVDGVCATAILVRALRALGVEPSWFLPSRIDDGYGLSAETVRRLATRGSDLLITVDCAITAIEEVACAHSRGIEVVVTDHHAPRADGQLPECPIVHPAVCGYPCPDLCGTAVAYKLAEALGAPTAEQELELVALATVADLMPLRGENRTLVRDGLGALAGTARPGLRALMNVAGADPSGLDAGVLGYRLAPRINAAGRMRRADAGLELLMTSDHRRAQEIAAELDAVNAERRAVEQRICWEAEAQARQLGERAGFVLAAEGWHPGVIGIVASRIVELHHRPAVLVALEDGVGTGSGRGIPGFDLLGALQACSQQLASYGGHRAAGGLTLRREQLDGFREAFERHVEEVLTPELLVPTERVDAVVSGTELGLPLAEELEALEPCGIGNPRSRLVVPGARFHDVRPMGEGRHARFSVTSGGTRARAVAFGCDGRLPAEPGEPVDATFRLERNVWKGAVEPRLILAGASRFELPPVDVLAEPTVYLEGVLGELERSLVTAAPVSAQSRTVLDRRGESALAVLADARAAGGAVLAVCAEVKRRLNGLRPRTGGFALASYYALERDPTIAAEFAQIVALDPPSGELAEATLRAGVGFCHLAWGLPELRFAQQMHELEYGLRASLVALYRGLRLRGRVTGEELERLLRGDGPHGRPARLGGRLIRVLAELELVSLDPDLPALAIAGEAQTALERSAAYRAYAKRYEDGRRYLSSANLQPND